MTLIRSDEALVRLRRRARWIPPLTTVAASALVATVPVVLPLPILPPAGLLTLLAWRLLRPELWSAWAALPLGLADDMLTGAPIGSGPVIWTACLLALDEVDRRMMWRDWRQDWLLAAMLVGGSLAGASLLTLLTGGPAHPLALWPQWLVSVACVPAFARAVARIDRWRLGR